MNDLPPDAIERARERVTAHASKADAADAWERVMAKVGQRRRRTRHFAIAAALVAGVVAIGAVLAISSQRSHGSSVEIEPDSSMPTDCVLPQFSGTGTMPAPSTAPVLRVSAAGAVAAPFVLDKGAFRVEPPGAGAHPLVSAEQAECAALASYGSDGLWMQDLGEWSGRISIGYGFVTIDPAAVAAAHEGVPVGQLNRNTAPVLPHATQFQRRLAWVVETYETLIYHGPAVVAGSGPPPSLPAGRDVAFVLDATTGSDALLYTATENTQTEPSVFVPAERVSVPWTFVSRSSHGYSGTIRATVSPCDGVTNPVSVQSGTAVVAVVVFRGIGQACGPPKEVTLELLAGGIYNTLPAELEHAPLGPFIAPKPTAYDPSHPAERIVQLSDFDNGRTIHLSVGQVVAIAPLLQVDHDAPSGVETSDANVLGPLDPESRSPVGEFRAWQAGTTDLTVPTSACHYPNQHVPPCSAPWIVRVVVS